MRTARKPYGKLSVCFVNALFHPFTGGVEKHMLELTKRLASRGVDVTVVTARLGDSPEFELMNGVSVYRVPCKEIRVPGPYPPPTTIAPRLWFVLSQLDEKKNFDVIHLENRWFPDFDVTALYALSHKKPFVITIHNARTLGISPLYTLFGSIYDGFLGRWVFKAATRIVSVSEWAKHDIAQLGVREDKIEAIHNGVDVDEFRPENASPKVRERLGVGKAPFLLFVGRVIEQKGLRYLIEAMPLVIKNHPDAKLVVVGRGNLLDDLKNRARRLGVEKSVLFPGFVSEDDLKSALASCDVFILPSLWEVLPIAVLEAMASGKPIVCTNAGGNEELVRNGFTGFVVPKRDPRALSEAINRLLRDEALLKQMGKASRERAVREFDWELITDKTLDFYERLLASVKN